MSTKGYTQEDGIFVFHPTWEQFLDFQKYVDYMESLGAHHIGLAKVEPLTFTCLFICFFSGECSLFRSAYINA